MILAMDTSTDLCSIIVIANEKTKSKIKTHLKQVHAEKIIFMIEQALGNINKTINDISSVAISIGPGSFTGLRIGLSVAKGLCYALGKPLITVPTLDAMAESVFNICSLISKYNKTEIYICPMLNAKQNDFYYSIYRFNENKIERIDEYQIGTADDLKRQLKGKTILLGDAVEFVAENFYNQDDIILFGEEFNYPDAYYVAKIARKKYENGEFADLNSTEPLYIKEFVVKTKEI